MSEAVLAAKVVEWMSDGWDVYQEVSCYGGYADIVGVREGIVWIVECKMTLSLSLIEQAVTRLQGAHYVSVAVPPARRSTFPQDLLAEKGIGVIIAGSTVEQVQGPRISRAGRHWAKRLLDSLEPEHKTAAMAGTNGGGRWSPWRSTCRNAVEYVRRHGEPTVVDMMRHINHHYGSDSAARSSMVEWLRRGSVKHLQIIEGRPLRVRITGGK